MKQISIDTNAYTAFMQGNDNIVEIIKHVDLIIVNTIVLGELLSGFAMGSREKKNRSTLSEFLNSSRVELAHPDEATANYYAKIYQTLRKKGKPIPTNDLWIAALSMQYGQILCTLDSHFKLIDNFVTCSNLSELYP